MTVYKKYKEAVESGKIPKDRELMLKIFKRNYEHYLSKDLFTVSIGKEKFVHEYTHCSREDMAWFMARVKSREEILKMFT